MGSPGRRASRWIRPRCPTKPARSAPSWPTPRRRSASKTSDLDALSGGAHQLATSLAGVRDQVDQAGRSVTAMTGTLNQVRQQLNTGHLATCERRPARMSIDGVVDAAAPMLAALNDSPAMRRRPVVQ